MYDPQLTAVVKAIKNILPGSQISWDIVEAHSLQNHVSMTLNQFNKEYGQVLRDKVFVLWFKLPSKKIGLIKAVRNTMPFSKFEKDLLRNFNKTIGGLIVRADNKADRSIGRIASVHSFENVLIARYLRGSSPSFWSRALAVNLLQELTFQYYEGIPCTSGFVFVNEPNKFIKHLNERYTYEPFDKKLTLTESFFNYPISYRYVDGKNTFYLIDNLQNVHGLLQITCPENFSVYDRANSTHLQYLLENRYSKVWIAYIGNHNDVNIILKNQLQLRWLKAHWYSLDRCCHMEHILISNGFPELIATKLIGIILAISEMRVGALILIADDREYLPPNVRNIDESHVGEILRTSIIGKKVIDLIHSIIGVFTSDGLTILAKDSTIISSGNVISTNLQERDNVEVLECTEIVPPITDAAVSGGGRTQAAIKASYFGTVIKVSEDGPISFYRKGKELIKLIR